ncbi:MAG: NusG domain II-containing protein [Spirochaetes bacterium]|nr:NusG domain II-containing protein [Spirochaetota bacterium]
MIKIKVADIIIILLCMSTALVAGYFIYGNYSPPELLEITSRGDTWVFHLGQNKEIPISGPLGSSIIVIDNRQAFFQYSPCADKLCVKSGHIGRSREWIGCLPNMIFIRIKGDAAAVRAENEIDTFTF